MPICIFPEDSHHGWGLGWGWVPKIRLKAGKRRSFIQTCFCVFESFCRAGLAKPPAGSLMLGCLTTDR